MSLLSRQCVIKNIRSLSLRAINYKSFQCQILSNSLIKKVSSAKIKIRFISTESPTCHPTPKSLFYVHKCYCL